MGNYINYVANFNDVSLMSIPYIQVYLIENYAPNRTLNMGMLARRDAQKLSSAFYQKRNIFIGVYVKAPSRALADKSLDMLYSIIQGQEGYLVIEQSGTVRKYTTTFSKIEKNSSGVGRGNAQPPVGGYADITLVFECSDSFGYDTNYTLITNQTGISAPLTTIPYTQGGSALTQVPHVEVKFTQSSPIIGSITIGNSNTGQALTVTRTFNQYDLLIIDCRTQLVTVNGIEVDFSGAFPEVGTGPQSLYCSDTFGSRQYNLFAYVYNRYV